MQMIFDESVDTETYRTVIAYANRHGLTLDGFLRAALAALGALAEEGGDHHGCTDP